VFLVAYARLGSQRKLGKVTEDLMLADKSVGYQGGAHASSRGGGGGKARAADGQVGAGEGADAGKRSRGGGLEGDDGRAGASPGAARRVKPKHLG